MGRKRGFGLPLAACLSLVATALGGPLLDECPGTGTAPSPPDSGWMKAWEDWMRRRTASEPPVRTAPGTQPVTVAPPQDPGPREREQAARAKVEAEERLLEAIENFRAGGSPDGTQEALRNFALSHPGEAERTGEMGSLIEAARRFRTRADTLLLGAESLLEEGQTDAAGDRCRIVLRECPTHRGAQALAIRIEAARPAGRGPPLLPAGDRETPARPGPGEPLPPAERLRRAERLARAGHLEAARVLLVGLQEEDLPEPLAVRARDLAVRLETPR